MPDTQPCPPKSAANPMGARTLPQSLQHQFEVTLARDLSGVRVYEDHRATLLGAQSYAQGTDIHFAPGKYDPTSEKGQALIGHELAHVVQQRSGTAASQPLASGLVEVPESSD